MPTRRTIVTLVVWLLVLPGALWTVLRLAGWDAWFPALQLMAYTPYAAVAALVPLVLAALLRRWWPLGVAALSVLLLAVVVLPRWLTDDSADAGATGPELRVMTANLLFGTADATDLVRLVRDQRVDVLALQELSGEFLAAANAAGLSTLLPHQAVAAEPGAGGSGLVSRYPLTPLGVRVNPGLFRQVRAVVTVPDGPTVEVESVHAAAPSQANSTPVWVASVRVQPPATVDGPLRILAGDFNATLDHHLLRDLVATGYRDAADVAGAGLTGTWGPYDGDPFPPVAIDHVLADRRIGVLGVTAHPVARADHRALLALLRLPTPGIH